MRGAWIEITSAAANGAEVWSLPVRGAWIEIDRKNDNGTVTRSLPVRGAWIEILNLLLMSSAAESRSL